MVFYRVKRVKGKYYLVKEWFDNYLGKKRSTSIGPCPWLEQIAHEAKKKRKEGKKTRGKGPVAQPGRALPSQGIAYRGKQPSGFPSRYPPPQEWQVEKFYEWCLSSGRSRGTCRSRANYLRRPLDPSNEHSVKAYRLWFKYLGRPVPEDMPRVPRSGVDIRVPGREEVFTSISRACSLDARLCMVYRLLLESGHRLKTVIMVLSNYDASRDKRQDGFYTYYIGRTTGSKRAFYLFHVSEIVPVRISASYVTHLAIRHGLVRPKYVRKFVSTRMIGLGLDSMVVNYIQGRAERGVLQAHYLDLYALALKQYPLYADWLRGVIQA